MISVKQALMEHLMGNTDLTKFPEVDNELVNGIAKRVFKRDPKFIMPLSKDYVRRELESLRNRYSKVTV